MKQSGDVVVLGGGLSGSTTAYYLACAGVNVILVEREGIGSQASGHNAGGVNPLHGAGVPGPLGSLAMESFRLHMDLWEALRAESRVDFSPLRISRIELALNQAEETALEEAACLYDDAEGFSAQWVDPEGLLKLEPRLNPTAHGGLYTYGNGALDSYQFNQALVDAARRRGVVVIADSARELKTSGDRVIGVELARGDLDCENLVVATGPWSAEAQAWLGIPIPVQPLKGQMLRTVLPSGRLAHDISASIGALYARGGDQTWIGGTEERCGFDRTPKPDARTRMVENAARLLPEAAKARIKGHFAGLRPVTPDGLPIVGQVPGWRNAYLAMGAGRKGVLICAGMGKAVADLIASGSTGMSIASADPRRFTENGIRVEC